MFFKGNILNAATRTYKDRLIERYELGLHTCKTNNHKACNPTITRLYSMNPPADNRTFHMDIAQ